ncbi:hypothetical protein SAMN05216553_105303 [Lentzea fradiae]|uniref:Phosphodiesterase n=1 Tax=Lentzea fradiae TaxID=200378 RepID=A0A1G7RH88_9PSEU|nr:hypothetical protein SAMN05216553_105303 [Lentzea fradiae]
MFRLLAKTRGARALHPRGVWRTGELRGGVPPFPAEATVTVRLSKGAGTRPGWPDVLGLALRVPTESGDWDLLLSSTGTGRWSRLVPRFVRRWRDARLGTLAPYRYRGELVWFMAVPDDREVPVRFAVHRSGGDTGWQRVAELTLHPLGPHARDDDVPVAFDPVRTRPAELELAPRWLAVAREKAYEGSRRGHRGS